MVYAVALCPYVCLSVCHKQTDRQTYGGGGWWRWALVSPDGVAPSRMVCVSASVNLPLHHKVQKFSSGTGSLGWSGKKGRKTVVVVWSVSHKQVLYQNG